MKFEIISIFSLLIICLISISVEGRGIWGAKRKRDEVEQAEVEGDGNIASASPQRASGFEASKRRFEKTKSNPLLGALPNRDQILSAINTYVEVMEKLLYAPEFENIITPEAIKSMFGKFPALGANPEVAALLQGEQFSNPEMLKQTIVQGITAIKESSEQLADLLSDPAQISAVLQQLPAEMQNMISGLFSGDFSQLKEMISNIPGLDSSQKKLISSMLDFNSNPEALKDTVMELLSDPDKIETARLQMLNNPEIAEMLGISKDSLEDKHKFEELIAQGVDAIGSIDEEKNSGSTKFGASMAA